MSTTFRWFARRRHCASGTCEIAPGTTIRPIDILPLLVLPAIAVLLRSRMPSWEFVWAMACALYAGCKWLTYRQARTRGAVDGLRALGYLLAWPGMDSTAFLRRTERVRRPDKSEWISAAIKTLLGATLLWVISRIALPINMLLAGWVGMVGVILVLHFGTFHLLSLGWRSTGVNAVPVMQNPFRSESLAEFWGRRWNTAFHELASRFTYGPLRRIVGAAGATVLVFLASGVIHELVITLPARGGYGIPLATSCSRDLGSPVNARDWVDSSGLDVGGAAGCSLSSSPPAPRSGCFPQCSFETSFCRCWR
jgi:hypothetical protein